MNNPTYDINKVKHDIHIKFKSYELNFSECWLFNMILDLGLVGGHEFDWNFDPHLYI